MLSRLPAPPGDAPPLHIQDRIAQLWAAAAAHGRTHAAFTLVKDDDLRIVLVAMKAGASLHTHIPHESMAIQVLQGKLGVHPRSLAPVAVGALVMLGCGAAHDIEALRDSAFFAYLPWASEIGGKQAGDSGGPPPC
jgi:quercetin dioxygenase-like cupin family protein